jgi:hypothetical protein
MNFKAISGILFFSFLGTFTFETFYVVYPAILGLFFYKKEYTKNISSLSMLLLKKKRQSIKMKGASIESNGELQGVL